MISFGIQIVKNYIILEGVKYIGKQFINHGLPKIKYFLRKNRFDRFY